MVDSRHSDSAATFKGQAVVRENVSWYTRDWVCRKRKCIKCDTVVVTIEILLDDLNNGWTPKI